jgi:uncharacterized membrane protein
MNQASVVFFANLIILLAFVGLVVVHALENENNLEKIKWSKTAFFSLLTIGFLIMTIVYGRNIIPQSRVISSLPKSTTAVE